MKIGIIGAGHIGGTLARLFTQAGHEVAIANSRGPETLKELVHKLGKHAHAATVPEVAKFGDVVVVSIPFGRYKELPSAELKGKVVIDTNNYYPERDGRFEELEEDRTTSSEMLQAHCSGARVVKAFNSIRYDVLGSRGRSKGADDRVAIPLSGNDAQAKREVAWLIDQIGFDPVDTGALAEGGRRHQKGSPAYAQALPATGLRALLGFGQQESFPVHPGP